MSSYSDKSPGWISVPIAHEIDDLRLEVEIAALTEKLTPVQEALSRLSDKNRLSPAEVIQRALLLLDQEELILKISQLKLPIKIAEAEADRDCQKALLERADETSNQGRRVALNCLRGAESQLQDLRDRQEATRLRLAAIAKQRADIVGLSDNLATLNSSQFPNRKSGFNPIGTATLVETENERAPQRHRRYRSRFKQHIRAALIDHPDSKTREVLAYIDDLTIDEESKPEFCRNADSLEDLYQKDKGARTRFEVEVSKVRRDLDQRA